jgi:hypothetical protein
LFGVNRFKGKGEKDKIKLFDKCAFFLTGKLEPPAEELESLITLGGGRVVSRFEDSTHCICGKKTAKPKGLTRKSKQACTTEKVR